MTQVARAVEASRSAGPEFPSPAPDLGELLLNAKLSLPLPRVGTVSRINLIQRARSSGCRIVGITAPAGYGKSALLAEWSDCEDRPLACVSFDRFDDDPVALLQLLASAYARIDPGRADLAVEVRGVGASVLSRAAPRLAAAFNACPVPFVLLLDDVHELRSPDCHDVLGLVIERIPDGSQLVAASRLEQPHLPRLRVSGDALALDASDLALDVAGAQQIFSEAHVSLTTEAAAEVTARTEGWPAGLYLAAQISAEGGSSALTVSGDDRLVADYLYRESLANQPDDVQRFLRRTAVLDHLCGPLCDAVLGTSDSAEQLRRLEASSLFVVPLHRQREWYRYHALFREFLAAELRRREPDMVDVLHLRAADWYKSNGSPTMAVEHLLRTADRHRAARLAAELSQPLYNAGRLSTLQRWLATLGDEAISAWPPLAVHACLVSVYTGDTVGAERWAAMVDAASFDLKPRDGSASFESARALQRALMCQNGPESALADATVAEAEEPPWSPRRPMVLWLLGEAHLVRGDVDEARDLFAEASTACTRMGTSNTLIVAQAELALLALDRGDSERAGEHLRVARGVIEAAGLEDYSSALLVYAAAARLAVSRGDVSEARRELGQAMRRRPAATYVAPIIAVRLRLQLAAVYLALGEPTTAQHLLREVDDILQRRPALGTLVEETEKLRTRVLAAPAAALSASPLSHAELRVLPYLQTHLTFAQIAQRLFISRNTVATHVHAIYRKLAVSSRDDAVRRATAAGVLGG